MYSLTEAFHHLVDACISSEQSNNSLFNDPHPYLGSHNSPYRYLFQWIKALLKWHSFQAAEEVKEAMMAALKVVAGKGLQMCCQQRYGHCQKCVTIEGNYRIYSNKRQHCIQDDPPSQTSIFRKIPIFTRVRFLCHSSFAYLIFWN
jgi:hypothetical protein